MTPRVRIALIMRRYSPSRRSHMPDVVGLLVERGAAVEVIHAEERVFELARLRPEHDLYVLKEKTGLSFSLAGALHALGAAILNPYPVSELLRDKIATFGVLRAAGVPTPETYAVAQPSELAPALETGPIIVKPYRGSGGEGVRVVTCPAELEELRVGDEPVFAQRYHRPDGRDRKIYAIGGELFGVKRVWPAATYEDKVGEAFRVPAELAEIAWRCGSAFGIDLFGVDVVESDGRPYVVDASSFPGFKGVPDAPLRLATYIHQAAVRAARGDAVPASGAGVARAVVRESPVELVLRALSAAPATPRELEQIRRLLDEMQRRGP